MKKLFVLLLLFSGSANAQNAFYDARYIMKWYTQTDDEFLGKNLDLNNSRQHKLLILDSINALIQSYDTAKNSDSSGLSDAFLQYSLIAKINSQLKKQYYKLLGVDTIIKAIGNSNIELKTIFPAQNSVSKIAVAFVTNLNKFKEDTNHIKSINTESSSLVDSTQIASMDSLKKNLIKDTTYLNRKMASELIEFQDSISFPSKETQRIIDFLHLDSSNHISLAFNPKSENFQNMVTAAQNDRSLTARTQSTVGLNNTVGFSQSEAIDALSILIVNRFKQEVMLTFVDFLKKRMENDSLLNELFQNALGILTNSNAFDLPTFGKVWTHALAEDFTSVTNTLSHSDWINKQIQKCNPQDQSEWKT